jgi:ribokinase
MGKAILVAGSLHYDVVVNAQRLPYLDETLAGSGVRYIPGGKGLNQAVAAAVNGARTYMAGRIGDDMAAGSLSNWLSAQGVDSSLVQIGKGEASGMSVAIVNADGEYGAVVVSAANLAFVTDDISIPADTGVLVLQNEIDVEANIAMARKARDAGAMVIINAAPARPLPDALAGLVDVLVVNRGEAAVMSGLAVDDIGGAMAAAARLCDSVGKVVVTLGAGGAVYMRAGGRAEHQPAFRADVISAHGAGDFFIGALASQMADGSDFGAAIHYAQAAAAIFVSTEIDKRGGIRPVHIRARLGED